MSRNDRLDALERQIPRDGTGLCLTCGGPGTYRRIIERARAGEGYDGEERCRRCDRLTFAGALAAVRCGLGGQ